MDLGDLALLLVCLILLPFAIGAAVTVATAIWAVLTLIVLTPVEYFHSKYQRWQLKRDDRKAEELGLTTWQYRRKKRNGEL